jgi:hypothetical protein
MQARTAFRLAMLKNGYWPLLNDCKRPIEKDWQKKRPDRAEVLSWDRSTFTSTGMKIDGDLAVIDADIREPALVDALAKALGSRYPELFARGLVRHAGEVKEAWFVRSETPFRRICSRTWCRGDPRAPAAIAHRVECFGSRKTRQFGIDGPHARSETGEIIDSYQFAGGASPASTPRAFLPVLPKAAFAAACNLFDEIAAAAGLTVVKAEARQRRNGRHLRSHRQHGVRKRERHLSARRARRRAVRGATRRPRVAGDIIIPRAWHECDQMHCRSNQASPPLHLHPRFRNRADAHARQPQAF